MTKGARRRNAGEMTPEQELRMEVLLLKEQLMELEEDYDDLWNFSSKLYLYLCDEKGLDKEEPYRTDLERMKRDRIT